MMFPQIPLFPKTPDEWSGIEQVYNIKRFEQLLVTKNKTFIYIRESDNSFNIFYLETLVRAASFGKKAVKFLNKWGGLENSSDSPEDY